MLLVNYIPELGLMNGSIGTVIDICSPNKNRCNSDDDSHYVVVNFEHCTIPEGQNLIPGKPRTYVPIPVNTTRCEKKLLLFTHHPAQSMRCNYYSQESRHDHRSSPTVRFCSILLSRSWRECGSWPRACCFHSRHGTPQLCHGKHSHHSEGTQENWNWTYIHCKEKV